MNAALIEVVLACCAGLAIIGLIVLPGLTLIHELAHGVAATVGTPHLALIQLGDPPFRRRLALGRIYVEWGAVWAHPHTGRCAYEETTALRHVAVALAGPLANVALGLALLGAAGQIPHRPTLLSIITMCSAGASLSKGAGDLLPSTTRRGDRSDGLQILDLIRASRRAADAPPSEPH